MQEREKKDSSEAEDIIRNGNCKIFVLSDGVKSTIVTSDPQMTSQNGIKNLITKIQNVYISSSCVLD